MIKTSQIFRSSLGSFTIDKVPLEYFVHTNDARCPPEDHALKMAKEIKGPLNLTIFEYGGNLTYITYPPNVDEQDYSR